MRLRIYQINSARDENGVKFEDRKSEDPAQGPGCVDPRIYDEVFNAEVDSESLEAIYCRFNTQGHPLFRGHALSVSDVVVTDEGAFYCSSRGFDAIAFDESLTEKPGDLMRVVYVEPNRPAYTAEVLHTLACEQKAVGGMIELVYNSDNTAIVCNEEAKLIGLAGNRRIGDGTSIIAGPFFVCGLTEDDFRSLTDKEVMKYMDAFRTPETISQEEVQADMGFTIYPMM